MENVVKAFTWAEQNPVVNKDSSAFLEIVKLITECWHHAKLWANTIDFKGVEVTTLEVDQF